MDILKKKMLAELKKSYGRITAACEKTDIVRQTHYNWLKDDPEYATAVEAIDEASIDHVESKLFDLIDGAAREVITDGGVVQVRDAPNPTACIFYLKTKGKKRGYIERQELTGADNAPLIQILPNL